MGQAKRQSSGKELWRLAKSQHGVVTRRQLVQLGFNSDGIHHRVRRGRLHRVRPGVYTVGRPELSVNGRFLAAVLSCGPSAVLSHESAVALWGIRTAAVREPHVSVPVGARRSSTGVVLHRRKLTARDVTVHHGIPVTTPICTLIDQAARLPRDQLERAINEADRLDLVHPEALRRALDEVGKRPGVAALRNVIDRRTFRFTRSGLERRFLPMAARAGLPRPLTRQYVNRFEVDFWWPAIGLIVETDGLRYHRTAAQQTRDRLRDQTHTAAGLTCLRFTHAQIRFEPAHVQSLLMAVARRLAAQRP